MSSFWQKPSQRSSVRIGQRGLNMVDLMIWMIIGALIATFAIQSVQQYRTAAIVYQMKNDLKNAADLAAARGVLSGFIAEDEVVYSVNHSDKSDGVTMSWGKFNVTDENPEDAVLNDADPNAEAMGGDASFGFSRASVIKPADDHDHDDVTYKGVVEFNGQEVAVDKSLVIVARHDEAPDIRVIYFFDSIYIYKEGPSDFPVDALPPVQDMPDTLPTTPPAVEEPEPDETTAPVPTTDPEPEPEETATQEPIESTDPEPEPDETVVAPEPVPSPTPTPTATVAPPAPSPTPTPTSTQAPAPTPSVKPTDPTPEPDPLIPAANRDPKTKKFLFCHKGAMHSNSYNGMIQGHQGHSEDIMPPIPPINYPGWNWNAKTAKVYYNNCVPLAP